jgi:hypothetical protein
MRRDRIVNSFLEIKRAFPDVQLSSSYTYILIPRLPLPPKFNKPYTPLLIKIDSDYQAPSAYVDKGLLVYGKESIHLSRELTESDMLERGWVKLCFKANWNPNFSLVDFVLMVMKFLRDLEEENQESPWNQPFPSGDDYYDDYDDDEDDEEEDEDEEDY